MSKRFVLNISSSLAVEVFQPKQTALYSLEAAAHLAGVSRRAILVYCRTDLIQPVLLPPHEMMAFTEQTIHTVRRIEQLRIVHGCDLATTKVLFALLDEVERLRTELRFWRDR
ncbi:MAG: hypothetical protein RRC34_06820 [Lentisphaeria bacterium]|nr:hypothetical protein [Lentisphaeria bacterium]